MPGVHYAFTDMHYKRVSSTCKELRYGTESQFLKCYWKSFLRSNIFKPFANKFDWHQRRNVDKHNNAKSNKNWNEKSKSAGTNKWRAKYSLEICGSEFKLVH